MLWPLDGSLCYCIVVVANDKCQDETIGEVPKFDDDFKNCKHANELARKKNNKRPPIDTNWCNTTCEARYVLDDGLG
jgi:hypothetical protein